jgi:hypothetical protein
LNVRFTLKATAGRHNSIRRYGPIVLQKSKIAGRQISRRKTKKAASADLYALNPIAEVACEFIIRR